MDDLVEDIQLLTGKESNEDQKLNSFALRKIFEFKALLDDFIAKVSEFDSFVWNSRSNVNRFNLIKIFFDQNLEGTVNAGLSSRSTIEHAAGSNRSNQIISM